MIAVLERIPEVQLRCGPRVFSGTDLEALSRVRVRQELATPSQCELTFVNLASGRIQGLEFEGAWQVAPELSVAFGGHAADMNPGVFLGAPGDLRPIGRSS